MGIFLKAETVKKEWTDYNGHMNLAFYVHIFDKAAEVLLQKFKIGGDSAKKDKKSTFVVETHTTYDQEIKLGEEVEVHLSYFDHDKKRIYYKVSMLHKEKKYLAATTEVISLYIDLNQRKVAEFEPEKIKIIDDFIETNSSKFNTEKLVFLNKLKKQLP
jgi:acyl-CoA thioester hydrolase|tara:strand:- start:21 stop:497 length:477 start_codon:yes stop_codon:yes gene_type:complete